MITCPFTLLPFEDHPNTSDRPKKTVPGKQTSELLAMIYITID